MYVNIYICIHVYVYIRAAPYIPSLCVYICINVCMHVCRYACMYAYTCLCVCVCVVPHYARNLKMVCPTTHATWRWLAPLRTQLEDGVPHYARNLKTGCPTIHAASFDSIFWGIFTDYSKNMDVSHMDVSHTQDNTYMFICSRNLKTTRPTTHAIWRWSAAPRTQLDDGLPHRAFTHACVNAYQCVH